MAQISEALRELAEGVERGETPKVVEDDQDDDHFLAGAGQADCVVTGEPHLLKLGCDKDIPILAPTAFLSRYFAEYARIRISLELAIGC